MAKTLEAKTPRSKTSFNEKNGDNRHTLGNPRWSTIPGVPSRKRAQEIIGDIERAKAATLLEEYRKQEAIRTANDIKVLSEHLGRLEHERRFPEAEDVRRQISGCDHAAFLAADAKLIELTNRAAEKSSAG
jgi:hypothetical protein